MLLDYDCMVLAAGNSSRMGTWKMGLPFRGHTIIETTVASALQVCNRVVLVTGFRADDINRMFERHERVITVYNPDFIHGMFCSIKAGIRNVTSDAWFLIPGDMPFVRPETYRLLSDAFTASREEARVESRPEARERENEQPKVRDQETKQPDAFIPLYRNRKGHPVLLGASLLDPIKEAPTNSTLKNVLSRVHRKTVPVNDAGVVIDIDTQDDFNKYAE